jgi:methyl-accepting chemotaxis protein
VITSFSRRLQLGFGIPIVVLLALSVVSYRSSVVSNEGTRWVRHTHAVIDQLSELRSTMQNIEVGYRGLVLVGDDRFLSSYGEGIASAPVALAQVTTLTADNSKQQRRIEALTTLVHREMDLADEAVRLRYDAGLRAASARVAEGDTLRVMEDIQGLLTVMRDDEQGLLVARQVVADRNYKWNCVVLALGSLVHF